MDTVPEESLLAQVTLRDMKTGKKKCEMVKLIPTRHPLVSDKNRNSNRGVPYQVTTVMTEHSMKMQSTDPRIRHGRKNTEEQEEDSSRSYPPSRNRANYRGRAMRRNW